MHEQLSAVELQELIERVFRLRDEDGALGIMVDFPDEQLPDHPSWKWRREMAAEWAGLLHRSEERHGLEVKLLCYRNVRANNAELPQEGFLLSPGTTLPGDASGLGAFSRIGMKEFLRRFPIVLAPTELSATAPLKVLCPECRSRAATMPGFSAAMIPALRLDYTEINRRVQILKELLDRAQGAELFFEVSGSRVFRLYLDLRFRQAHASGGLIPEPGTAGNLPSGEAYIVPYEGEKGPGLSAGILPVELEGETVVYRIENNRAVEILSKGRVSSREEELIHREPGYANLAELGLGVLRDFGISPIGEVLLDEKLGLHIAFGRSDHFGGQVGPEDFSSPGAVTHQDRVYIPELQPDVSVTSVQLLMDGGEKIPLMENGRYVLSFS